MLDSLKSRLMSADEAVGLIADDAYVRISGTALVCSAAMIFKNIEASFLATGHPRNLCIVSEGSPGYNVPGYDYFSHLAHEGLVKRVIGGHMGMHHALFPMIRENHIEGYNISQGVLSILTNEQAAGKNGYLTKVGLRTQQDPRFEGCKLNQGIQTADVVELKEIDGEEYLWFKAIPSDVTVLRASYADKKGNITLAAEPSNNDALASAMATKNSRGKTIVYVKEIKDEHFCPRLVHIPYYLVDAIIVDSDLVQASPGLPYNPFFSNELRCDDESLHQIMKNALEGGMRKRDVSHRIIARRAAMEMKPDSLVNVGIGIPQLVSREAQAMGIDMSSVVMTTETGISGGVQHPSVFSVSLNADAVYDQATQFRFYEGGALDIGVLGALQVDEAGNVNVCRSGPVLAGVGGFNYIVYSAKKLIFCFNFMRGSGYSCVDGKLTPITGKGNKLVPGVESISMNAGLEYEQGKTVLYITERCVFRLGHDGLELSEIAPGLDLEKDVLAHLPFLPKIAEDLKPMPAECFSVRGIAYE